MKHLITAAAIISLLLAATASWMLIDGQTALISASGLLKLALAAAAGTFGALAVRWTVGLIEGRDGRRWTVSAHPASWLAAPLVLAAAMALWTVAHHFGARPSMHGDWSVGIYLSSGSEPTDFKPIGPQPALAADHVTDLPCAFVADPVLVAADGELTLFYEAWNTATDQGDICASTSPDGLTWTYRGRVLDEDCSLSYPTVFNHRGTWYMIPETRELAQLRLYRAERFPDHWVLDRVLLDGAPYRDTNLVQADARWYLLTTTDPGSNLLVFNAEDPLGPWQPHPQNPVVQGDSDHARGGGNVVRTEAGWVRFVQDVKPYYGNRVRAVMITDLSPDAYRQRPLGPEPALVGHDDWNVRGMHTLWCVQRDDGRWLAAVDGHGSMIDTKPARWWR
jgi:hypothetical protein